MLTIVERQNQLGLNNDIKVTPARSVIPGDTIQRSAIASLAEKYHGEKFGRHNFKPFYLEAKVLPHTCLLDVERGEPDNQYRYRVFSTEMRETVGADLCHKTVHDYPKRSCRTYLMRLHDECLHQAKPVFSKAHIAYPRGFSVLTEKTLVPLFDPTLTDVTMILTVFTFSFNSKHPVASEAETEPNRVLEEYQVYESIGQLHAAASKNDGLRIAAKN